tara:strand:+ start:302 stop:727 length:426 start_codon:yes stop_codon:yes gene_type:complete
VGGNKKNKGNGTIAEAQVLVKLLQQGFGASWAIGDSMGWDLVSDWQGKVTRLQVKSTQAAPGRRTWRILFGHGRKVKELYEPADCDAFVCVLPWGMYVIPRGNVDGIRANFWPPGEHPRYSTSRFNQCKYESYREAWHHLK